MSAAPRCASHVPALDRHPVGKNCALLVLLAIAAPPAFGQAGIPIDGSAPTWVISDQSELPERTDWAVIGTAGTHLQFRGNINIGNKRIFASPVYPAQNVTLSFADNANAGNSYLGVKRRLYFIGASSAGSATINATDTAPGGRSIVEFRDSATAANANLVLLNAALAFRGSSDAGQAVIVVQPRSSIGHESLVSFHEAATADHATLDLGLGSLLDVSAVNREIGVGSLSGDGDVFIGAKTLVVGGLGRTETLAGKISGAGSLAKIGSGTLTLSGNSDALGSTDVRSGGLVVNGVLGGMTTLQSGATLSGEGRLQDVTNGGVLSPGNGLGALSVRGNYIHQAGAILRVDISPDGTADRLDVGGTVALNGGSVQVTKLPGQYAGGTRYTLVEALGGLSGRFDTLSQDLPFLRLKLDYDVQRVYLDVLRSPISFADVCVVNNECGVARVLDGVSRRSGPLSPDMERVIEEMTTLDAAGARAALRSLAGEAHASLAALVVTADPFDRFVARRVVDRRVAGDDARFSSWLAGNVGSSQYDGDRNASGLDVDLSGAAFGVDGWFTDSLLLGASLGRSRMAMDFASSDRAKAHSRNIALYASFHRRDGYLDGTVGYGRWSNELTRRIAVGEVARDADSSYDANRYFASLEAGWMFRPGGSRLQPFARFEHAKLHGDGFVEQNAQDMSLTGRAHRLSRSSAGLGVRWGADFNGGGWAISPSAELGWSRRFGARDARLDLAFAEDPSQGFRVVGVSAPKNGVRAGLGMLATYNERLNLFFNYDVERGDGQRSRGLEAGLRYLW